MRVTVKTDTKVLEARLNRFDHQARRAITGVMRYHKGVLTREMKKNAPWRDDSGAARKGLFTEIFMPNENTWVLVCAHTVEYGIYLETKWMGTGDGGYGKYAIIMPTIKEWSPVIMDRISQRIANLRGGPESVQWEFDA